MSRLAELEAERAGLVAEVNIARDRVEEGPGRWERRSVLEGLLAEAEAELAEWDRCHGIELNVLRAKV